MNFGHLISNWLIWSNDRMETNKLEGETPPTLDHSYIDSYKVLNEFHGADRHVFYLRVYVNDELHSFDLIAVYGPHQTLLALLSEIDTTWYTIFTNEGN